MSRARIFAAPIALLMMLAVGFATQAQTVTSSHVYQTVDEISNQLAIFHQVNGSQPERDRNAPALTQRRPRHVYQKARETFEMVQTLRQINGLPTTPTPPAPLAAVTPADVRGLVNRILAEVKGLRAVFGVAGAPAPAALKPGKTPTDVYANLVAVDLQIDGLGIPRIVPNDVYRIALAIIGDLEKIRAARGIDDPIAVQTGASGKKPEAVFEAGLELLAALQATTSADDSLATPGGIVLPNRRPGKIRPKHVIDLLNNALAEIDAIKVTVGVRSPTVLPPPQSGKTPSDVFDAVKTAILIARSL